MFEIDRFPVDYASQAFKVENKFIRTLKRTGIIQFTGHEIFPYVSSEDLLRIYILSRENKKTVFTRNTDEWLEYFFRFYYSRYIGEYFIFNGFFFRTNGEVFANSKCIKFDNFNYYNFVSSSFFNYMQREDLPISEKVDAKRANKLFNSVWQSKKDFVKFKKQKKRKEFAYKVDEKMLIKLFQFSPGVVRTLKGKGVFKKVGNTEILTNESIFKSFLINKLLSCYSNKKAYHFLAEFVAICDMNFLDILEQNLIIKNEICLMCNESIDTIITHFSYSFKEVVKTLEERGVEKVEIKDPITPELREIYMSMKLAEIGIGV